MTMTDPIADLLTRIRNGLKARHEKVVIPSSKMKIEIVKILKEEGYIENFKIVDDGKQGLIEVFLKYFSDGKPVISGIERISRPGRRVYFGKDDVPRVLGGYGITIVSTSRGLMTGKQSRAKGYGGEILCNVW
ncbi:MAG: 30S ribosomal protein S8 [Acidobacteriota bacterium]